MKKELIQTWVLVDNDKKFVSSISTAERTEIAVLAARLSFTNYKQQATKIAGTEDFAKGVAAGIHIFFGIQLTVQKF